MKKVTLVLSILLIAVFVFGCASTPSPTSAPAKPATSAAPATTAAPASSAAPPSTTAAPASSAAPATSAAPAASDTIKVGVIMSTTGPDAILSPGLKAALEYRVDQYGGQIAGRKVQLIIEDDSTDPVTGVDKARKLLQSDKVDVIMGCTQGAVAGAVANFMSKANITVPLILFMPKSATVAAIGNPNIYLPFGTNGGGGYYSGLYASQKLGYKTATVANEDMIGAQEFIDGAVLGFKKGGGSITQSQVIPGTTNDFSPNLTAMKDADCVLFWFTPVRAQRFVSQYIQAGIKMPLVMAYVSVLSPKALSDIGEKSVGIVGADMYTSLIDRPANKTFVDAFVKKYGIAALSSNSVGADVAITIFLEGVKANNGDTTPDKLNATLHKNKVDTEASTFSFPPTGVGMGIADLYILKSAKTDAGFAWSVLDKYSQVSLDAPK
jgi:branched-chain amino acid transport system substrate-binding protein